MSDRAISIPVPVPDQHLDLRSIREVCREVGDPIRGFVDQLRADSPKQ